VSSMATNRMFKRHLAVFSIVMLSLLYVTAIGAQQLGNVSLPDKVTLKDTDVELQLNGMGYRSKFFVKVYVGALYTESKASSRDAVQALTGPKRVVMHFVYDEVSREKMSDAWHEGFEDNNSDEQLAKLQARLNTFVSYFPDLKEGDEVLLDYIPASGTHVMLNGKEKGVIEGADFYRALLDVWLGDEPADGGLKEALLGNPED
jgi:hypothetical protein